jgi:hypothetical protein
MFQVNMGSTDRVIRAIAGVALVILAVVIGNVIPAVLGAVLLVTATISFCPVYLPFGLSTRRKS